MKTFPEIAGVEFRIVPGFPEYAVSSDGRVWNARGRGWQVVPTFRIDTGQIAVFLHIYKSDPSSGTRRFTVEELLAAAFSGGEDEARVKSKALPPARWPDELVP
jgi:hypothetical protein